MPTDHMSRGEMLELMRSEAVTRRDAIRAHAGEFGTPGLVDLGREVELLTGFIAATEALQTYAHEMKAARIARAR